jgi:hypothetical protein
MRKVPCGGGLECKLSIVQGVEQWTVCTPLSVHRFVTLATQEHLKYHCKALFETACKRIRVKYVNEKTEIKSGIGEGGSRRVIQLARIRNCEENAAGHGSRCSHPKNEHKSCTRRINNAGFLQLRRETDEAKHSHSRVFISSN